MNVGSRPGPRERHLLRRRSFPDLFGTAPPDETALRKARAEDEEQAAAFMERFRDLVGQAASLGAHEESERILDLKAKLDHAYAEAASLGGNQDAAKAGIRRLTEIIMQSVRNGAGNDPAALAELDDEAMARRHHTTLLEYPLVADLMLPGSPVTESELVPTLLSESAEAVEAALWLYDPEQVSEITAHGRALLAAVAARGVQLPDAEARLAQLERSASPPN